jgi:hypothetical protein
MNNQLSQQVYQVIHIFLVTWKCHPYKSICSHMDTSPVVLECLLDRTHDSDFCKPFIEQPYEFILLG